MVGEQTVRSVGKSFCFGTCDSFVVCTRHGLHRVGVQLVAASQYSLYMQRLSVAAKFVSSVWSSFVEGVKESFEHKA